MKSVWDLIGHFHVGNPRKSFISKEDGVFRGDNVHTIRTSQRRYINIFRLRPLATPSQ